jgi:pimeloyl-ACP methyl ester carboxylesterase
VDVAERYLPLKTGVTLHARMWSGQRTPFVLLHGLASNCRTWDMVSRSLARAGHPVVAVDQRGHGLSEKPPGGYDFDTVSDDLAALIDALALDRPVVVGQSWGGNVVLAFGARHPGKASALGFVDGGFLDLQARRHNSWEAVSQQLRPPDLNGTRADALRARFRQAHPDWTEEGIEGTLANFEQLADGTVRPQLQLENHMAIVRALWEQRPRNLYPRVQEPVLICPASDGNAEWTAAKRAQVEAAESDLRRVSVRWFENTDHDIHIHRPDQLVDVMLMALRSGIWQEPTDRDGTERP